MPESRASVTPKRRVHWHALAVHFPISLFSTAFMFQLLHFFSHPDCFELSANVALVVGTAVMIPTLWSGWVDWRKHYKAARGKIFLRKIRTGFAMLVVSLGVSLWRSLWASFTTDIPGAQHIIFFAFVSLLILGSIVEGYYGGRLGHRF
jgi:uncharacterized membrane protein